MFGWVKKVFVKPLDLKAREEALYEDALLSEWVAINASTHPDQADQPESVEQPESAPRVALRAVEEPDLFLSRVYSSQGS